MSISVESLMHKCQSLVLLNCNISPLTFIEIQPWPHPVLLNSRVKLCNILMKWAWWLSPFIVRKQVQWSYMTGLRSHPQWMVKPELISVWRCILTYLKQRCILESVRFLSTNRQSKNIIWLCMWTNLISVGHIFLTSAALCAILELYVLSLIAV